MSARLGRRALAEAIGTYFLVLIGPGAAMVDAYSDGAVTHPGVALSFAFVVLAMIYALGHISGAHINPAVTIAFWSAGRFPARDVVPYVAAQCAGAVAASFTMGAVVGPVGSFGATVPAVSVGGAFAVEWLLSFVLMLVIMAVATDERVAPGFAGIAVGLTVGFCAMAGGPLTGASMNPARSLGPAVAGGPWEAHWIYWAAPITAMLVAVRAYEFLRPAGSGAEPAAGTLGVEARSHPLEGVTHRLSRSTAEPGFSLRLPVSRPRRELGRPDRAHGASPVECSLQAPAPAESCPEHVMRPSGRSTHPARSSMTTGGTGLR